MRLVGRRKAPIPELPDAVPAQVHPYLRPGEACLRLGTCLFCEPAAGHSAPQEAPVHDA